jgi:hypothetical protein
MPIGTCDPASRGRGETYNEFAMEVPLPDGSGYVLIDCRYTWDGTSTRATGCDGPVIFLRTRNTGASTAWAMLPDKKKAPLWVQLDPGTDVTVTQKGQLANLGLSNSKDVETVQFSFTDPTAA